MSGTLDKVADLERKQRSYRRGAWGCAFLALCGVSVTILTLVANLKGRGGYAELGPLAMGSASAVWGLFWCRARHARIREEIERELQTLSDPCEDVTP